MRYNDIIKGTNVAEEVVAKYRAAWAEKGMISETGLFKRFYWVRQKTALESDDIGHTAW